MPKQISEVGVSLLREIGHKEYMRLTVKRQGFFGFTLLELLCVMSLIIILASMVLGPCSRVLFRVRADQWWDEATQQLHATISQMRQKLDGNVQFPIVTLERIEADGLLEPAQLRFLKDRRVTFIPFSGSDPYDKVILYVKMERGFFYDAGLLTETVGAITKPPD